MTILQDFRPITRATMAQLSLPDIRAYAKAYKVPADVIERGTVDELLDFIFRLRPSHPKEYPINTPHLFAHKIIRTQEDRDKEFLSHKPYNGFAYRQNLAKFRRTKSRIDRPVPPEQGNQTEEATGDQRQGGGVEGEGHEDSPAQQENPTVDQPVASSSTTQTNEQPNTLAEDLPGKLGPVLTPSHPTVPDQGTSPAPAATTPANNGPEPSQPREGAPSGIPASKERETDEESRKRKEEFLASVRLMSRGDRPPPVPPPLGFEVADNLSNLKSALEEHEEAMASQPEPSRIIVDDELFGLKFTPDMTQAGKEAIISERCAIATSNHKMIEQMLAEAEAEAKQALWLLTALQPRLDVTQQNIQKFVNEFGASTNRRGVHLIRKAISDAEKLAKDAWELDWNEEWIFTEDDEKEEDRMREIAQARAAGARVPLSPSATTPHSPGRKRARDEDEDELEYADEGEPRAGALELGPKRPRVESRETSVAPSSPSPKKGKGKGRALAAEDSYMLPLPSSSFYIPPPPMPRFGPEDRCNVYPIYKPAVPSYDPSKPSGDEDEGQSDGGRLPPSDIDDNSNDGPEPEQGRIEDHNHRVEQTGEVEGHGSAKEAEGDGQNPTQTLLRGAPPPARAQPKVPQRVDPWEVIRYDRSIWQGYSDTDHTHMASELKRPVGWSVMGLQHPKGANYREWDDALEEQNPWHQGGRPILEQ